MNRLDPSSPEVEVGYKLLNGAKIKFPDSPTEIKLYFSRHGNDHKLPSDFTDDLQNADIFCFEAIGWEQWQLDMAQRVAEGDPDTVAEVAGQLNETLFPEQAEFARRVYRDLFGSMVKVHFPDVPKNHPLFKEQFRSTRAVSPLLWRIEKGQQHLVPDNELQVAAGSLMRQSVKRDKYVLEHFFPKNIETKPIIHIVGFFGLMHSGIATILAREAHKQERDDITVMASGQHEAPALYSFLNRHPNSKNELVDLLRYWADSP